MVSQIGQEVIVDVLFPPFEDVLEAGAIIGLDDVPLSNSLACLILFVSTDTL